MYLSKYFFVGSNMNSQQWVDYSKSIGSRQFKKYIDENFEYGQYNPTLTMKHENIYKENELEYNPRGASYFFTINKRQFNKDISNISFIGNSKKIDSYMYYDSYKGRRRLNIEAHGALNKEYFGDEGGRIVMGGHYLDSEDIIDFLKDKPDFDSLRLITCYSGDGGDASLISRLSSSLKKPVKGYSGQVFGQDLDEIDGLVKKVGVTKARETVISDHMLGRGAGVNEVCTGSRRYVRSGRAVMAGIEFF